VPELVFELEGRRVAHALDRDEVTVGRSADNDVVIKDALVSRHHAKVHRVGDAWRVTDLGSSNGTRVNDRDPANHDLRNGDRIQLHKFDMLFIDSAQPGLSLTPDVGPATTDPLGSGTVIRSAVDFSALASSMQETLGVPKGGENRLERLLDIVTKASEALLSSTSLDDTLSTVLDLVFEQLNVDAAASSCGTTTSRISSSVASSRKEARPTRSASHARSRRRSTGKRSRFSPATP